MAAPGTTAPVLSVIFPTTVAVPVVCAKATETNESRVTKYLNMRDSQPAWSDRRQLCRLEWRIRVLGGPRQVSPVRPNREVGADSPRMVPCLRGCGHRKETGLKCSCVDV